MAVQFFKHGGPALPWYSIPYWVGLLTLSLLDHLWHLRQPATHTVWASHLMVLINLVIICNPISWGYVYNICRSLGTPGGDGGDGWANFALGLLLASHGLCLTYQGLGRRLPGFWPQAAQQVLLVALATRHNPSMCSELQLDLPRVRELLLGAAAHHQALVLLPAAAPLDLPWVNSLPLAAQCRAVMLFWQLTLGLMLPLSVHLRRCQVITCQGIVGEGAVQQPSAEAPRSGRPLSGTWEEAGSRGRRSTSTSSSSGGSGGGGTSSSRTRRMIDGSHMGSQPGTRSDSAAATLQAQPGNSRAMQSLLASSTLRPRMLASMALQLVAVAWLVAVVAAKGMPGHAAAAGDSAGNSACELDSVGDSAWPGSG